jgi:salicylate hydroxylase
MLQEVGAAIHVQPNATRVLVRWDFDVRRARLVTSRSAFFVHGDSLEAFSEQYYEATEKKYGAEFYLSHRVDLHNELKRLATMVDGPGRPAEVLLRKEVRGFVC